MTRASHRVYAVFEPEKGEKNKFSGSLFENQGEHFQHAYSADEALILERPLAVRTQQAQQQIILNAQPLPEQHFYARGKPVLVIWHSI